MPTGNLSNKLVLITGVFFFLIFQGKGAHGETLEDSSWHALKTRHTIIRYTSLQSLKKFNLAVDYYPEEGGNEILFSFSDSDKLIEGLKKKIDALFERVQEILDMRKRMKRVAINIYPNEQHLRAAYYKIYKNKCRLRAWYIYEYNTIYINVNDLHEGMLAHEMGHSIIDHYLKVRPPSATAEILARYVDSHLFDE